MTTVDAVRHEYRIKGWLRVVYSLLSIFLSGVGLFVARSLVQQSRPGAAAWVAIFPLAIGIYLLALALRSRLVIDGTRIEARGAFQEKTADLSDIEGYRTVSTRNGSYWQLKLKDGRGSLTIQQSLDCDDLRAWMQQLTDLDERDRKELLAEIEQDQELGATPEDRLQALKRAKSWNIGLSAIAVAAAVGTFAGGAQWRLPAAVVLALVPIAVIYLLNRGPLLYVLGKSKRDPRTELSIALFVASMGFFFNGIQRHFVSLMPLLPSMALAALAFISGFAILSRNGPRAQGFYAVMLMCAGFYSFGLISACDTLLDHGQPTPYQAQVVRKHVVHGKSTTYYLDFDAWGPFEGTNKIGVPYGVYRATEPGDTVCFEVHPGALHALWYERVDCEAPQEIQTTP